jgi:hypothetical protein
MTNEIVKDPGAVSKHLIEDADRAITKHEHFLALLKKQYGYTNEKAVDELERLLKMFSTMNKSLGIHQAHTDFKHPQILALKNGGKNFTMRMQTSRKGESHEKRSGFMD